MKQRRANRLLQYAVGMLSVVLVAVAACDSGTKEPAQKTQASKKSSDIRFVDASKGLPDKGLWRRCVAFFDLNKDGHLDIVAPPARKASEEKYKRPIAWYGNGRGEWLETALKVPSDISYHYGTVAVADFDGDKIPDLALAMHGLGIRVLKGVGDGKYVDFSGGLPPGDQITSRGLVVTDMDNDGRPDIVAISENPAYQLPGKPDRSPVWGCSLVDGKWKCAALGNKKGILNGLFGYQLAAGDVNGDGNTDLALSSYSSENSEIVWLGDGKGGLRPFNGGLPQNKVYFSVALADINKDGRDDLLVSMSGFGEKASYGLKAFLSRQTVFEDVSEGLPDHDFFTAITAADLNDDGIPEFIGGTVQGGIKIFSFKGDRWEPLEVSGLPEAGLERIYGVYCLDMNRDGLKDIAMNYAQEKKGGGIRVFFRAPAAK